MANHHSVTEDTWIAHVGRDSALAGSAPSEVTTIVSIPVAWAPTHAADPPLSVGHNVEALAAFVPPAFAQLKRRRNLSTTLALRKLSAA